MFRELFTEGKSYATDLKLLKGKLVKAKLAPKKGMEHLDNIIQADKSKFYKNGKALAKELKRLLPKVEKAGIKPKDGLEKLKNMIDWLERA